MPLHEGELNPPSSPAADSLQGNGRTTTRPASKMRNRREYRGIFSSSICDMFSSSRKSKTDACALACCGIWLWERNQFLLQGKHPKGWMQRPMETIVVCLLLASAVIWTLAPHSLALQVCLLTAIVLALWRFLEFEYTRSKFRKEMAVEEYRRQNLLSANGDEMIGEPSANDPRTIPQRRLSPTSNGSNNVNYDDHENNGLQLYLSSNWNEIHRRHHIFSCVKNDTHSVEEDDEEDNLDFCQRLWQCLASLCCNTCCMCWCLCCGMCAIAQEHRHLAQVLPESPALWQRDYITMQPWSDYFPSILQLRNARNLAFLDHVRALSDLSRRLVYAFGSFFLFAIVVTLLPVRYDRWQLAVMFGALAEPVIILFFTYWYWNRLDLSTDAIVKYFSSGFFLCTSMVLVYELLASIASSLGVFLYSFIGSVILVAFGEVDLDNLDEVNVDSGTVVEVAAPGLTSTTSEEPWHKTLEIPTYFVLTIAILSALLNAFFVAAVVEELFKYLSFWMVEHPDLENEVSLVPLEPEATIDSEQLPTEDAGLLSGAGQTGSYDDGDAMETASMAKSKAHPVSLESRGAAITVAMITVAVGFACAENLLYIFVYTESNIAAEATTLVLRALFPVHPLCAAIQSIGVVRRDVEKDKSIGVGRIIFAAWLLHGSFDFLLMAYSAVMEIVGGQSQDALGAGKDSPETVDDEATTGDWVVLGCSLLIPLIGLEYYFFTSRLQTKRLRDLDNGRVSSSQILNDQEIL